MKIRVISTMKGKLTIPYVYGSFKSGEEVVLTKEQAESSDIQNLLNLGLIEFVDKQDMKNIEETVEYKNLSKTVLSFSWGDTIRPSQSFFLPNKRSSSFEVEEFIKSGKICKVSEEKNENKKKIKKVSEVKSDSKDVYIHKPENKKISNSLSEENDEIEFVDIKQTKERLAKTQKYIQGK